MTNPLDPSFIEELLKKPATLPKTRRSVKSFTTVESRTYTTWFTLRTTFTACDNPECVDERPMRTSEGNSMCAVIEDKNICRRCFLDGWLVALDNG